VAGPVAVAVDVPVDAANSQLFLQKTTTTTVAALGDFVQYTLSIENTGTVGSFQTVSINDQLPWGVRYRKGSTRVNGQVAADPLINAEGRGLTFALASLPPARRVAITYVVEITQSARGPNLTNSASATSVNGGVSNPAQATIRLRDDFFRDTAVVMGRVVEGDCKAAANTLPGIAGVRVYLEDGRYSVTDDEGKYHFEGVEPGSHVVQIDTVSIPEDMQSSECDGNVRHSGRSYSQFVDVRGGALWRADFTLAKRAPPEGKVGMSLSSTLVSEMELNHSTIIKVDSLAIDNASLVVMLPAGLTYVEGSTRNSTGFDIEPKITDNVLSFKLGNVLADTAIGLSFRSRASSDAAGALNVKSYLMFGSAGARQQLTTPIENRVLRGEMIFERANYRFSPRFDVLKADLKTEDRTQLDQLASEWSGVRNVRVVSVGHTDANPITVASQAQFKDNYELSLARASAVADYLRVRLNLKPEQLLVEGKGADEPLTKESDAANLARNRRVEIYIDGMRVKALGKLSVAAARGEAESVKTVGVLPSAAKAKTVVAPSTAPKADAIDVEALAAGSNWLAPLEGAIPAISSVKVAIQHAFDHKVELSINGAPVSALNFDGSENNKAKTITVSRWIGIDLTDGDNNFLAVVRDNSGTEVARLTRAVHFAGGAVRAEFVKEQSLLVADGKAHPIIALRMFDAAGKPARPGTQGIYHVDAPYRSWWEVQTLQENQMLVVGQREPTFRVDDDGLARIELEPSTQSGNVMLRLRFNERQNQDVRVWLTPQARDWVLVGLAEGTGAHRTITDNMQNAADAGLKEGLEKDGRVAFFAKGRIKGEFLMTIAYDSARERKVEDPRLLGTIEPDRYYTVYGDGTEQRFEAASQEKLYVKLEREQFVAMFGDFETGLTVTELSRYSRTLTGFKSDFSGERFNITTFAAQTEQGFVKDELIGDGTSGLYRLSQDSIIANSDKIRIEVRDRFRSEVIVETRLLTRYIDYSIDYFNGTLFFKQPVASRDADFNPQFIIAEYEVLQGGDQQVVGGTRAAMKFAGDKIEVGTSYMQEGAAVGDTRLAGTDLRVKIGENTTVRAEIARSESDNPLRAPQADAYFTEVKHISERVDASVYFREQESQFGFGQQLSTETGTRKTGLDGRVKLTDTLAVRTEAYQQTVISNNPLVNDAERQMASAELRHETTRYGVGLGARHVSDVGLTNEALTSDLANINGNIHLFDDRVLLKAAHDWSLGDDAESADFPARSVVGIDYKLTQATSLFSEYEHSEGAQISSDMTRVGLRTTPWQRAQISSSLNQQFSEYGPRTFANLGLTQGWQINDRWAMDLGADQNKTVRGSNLQPLNRNVPLASGSLTEDFLATSIAAMYRGESWTLNSRVEQRDSDLEKRWTYVGGFYREPAHGHAFSLATQFFTSEGSTRADTTAGLIRMAWAYRPVESRWIILDRLDLKHDKRTDTLSTFDSSRLINNLNANWQLNNRTQAGVQFGARYVVSSFDGEQYKGFSTLYGMDVRRDLSERFDVGVHGTFLNSWNSGTSDTAIGVDLGVTIARNVWVSVGYNLEGFNDRDFQASRYTSQGPFIKLRIKADQDTFKDLSTAILRPEKKNQ
ncbi:MAG: OmpA family protein, partial [Candidatus Obscuribacterales bacterium]|nr:OmpA family protein [Steroidobacteraceae bacterium]